MHSDDINVDIDILVIWTFKDISHVETCRQLTILRTAYDGPNQRGMARAVDQTPLDGIVASCLAEMLT